MFGKIVYDVTFSFAEEDDYFVRKVVEYLKSSQVKYYYYKENPVVEWGKNLEAHLSLIYEKQSRFCVVFVSAHYKQKIWTKFELGNASKKIVKENQEYILPFKMDATDLPEIPSAIKYFTKTELNAQDLAAAILRKVKDHKRENSFPRMQYHKTVKHLFNLKGIMMLIVLCLSVFWFSFRNQLTPVDQLTLRLYEASKTEVRGNICDDGSFSMSQGSGTCSGSKIFRRDIDSMMPTKTFDQCRELARRISWIP